MLVPQSSTGTPRSVHDVMSEAESVVPDALRTHIDESPPEMSVPSGFRFQCLAEHLWHRLGESEELSLIWRPDPVSVDPDVPDSHDRRLFRVKVSVGHQCGA